MAAPKIPIPQPHPSPHSNRHTLPPTAPPPPLRRLPRRKDDLLSPSVSVDINAQQHQEAQQRRSELLQIVNLLTLAHHRNKNQHRRSRWWKELGMLRRNLRRAVVVGDGGIGEDLGFGARGRSDVVYDAGKKGKGEKLEEEERILGFVRSRLIPRCWAAFSGLVADTQYAGLGLMLLGTLARLAGVVGWEEGQEQEQEGEEDNGTGDVVVGDMDDVADLDGKEEEMAVHQSLGVGQSGEDLGVPLVREEFLGAGEVQMTESVMHTKEAETVAVPAETKSTSAKRKGKKKHRDAIDELFSSLI